jgi:hypothetical protein
MFERRVSVRCLARVVFLGALWSLGGGVLSAAGGRHLENAAPSGAVLYRIFLRDGSAIVSYGEFARVADQLVVSIRIGGSDADPLLHVVTIPEHDVEWERTNAYVHAARAKRYAETRGEFDFSLLTREVADTLYQVGTTNDAPRRLALAEDARRRLVAWAPQHYNYRATELAQMTTWLDQVVSELRVAAGQSSFDLALVAMPSAAASPAVELLPPPSFREGIELALAAARRTSDPAARVSLLRALLDALPPDEDGADGGWVVPIRMAASAVLAAELRTDSAYATLTAKALARASALQQKADVRALEAVVGWVLAEDRKLNQARPAALAGLLSTLDLRIDAARRLRLAQDAWVLRTAVLQEYWRDVRQALDRLLGVREWLIDVRQLAGPAPRSLVRLGEYAARAQRELTAVTAPPEVTGPHSTLAAAAAMAVRAASARHEAVRSARMDVAWQASSAAAGSLMLLDQAIEELRRITHAPPPTFLDCQTCQSCQNCR